MEHMEPGIPHTEKQSQLSEEKLGVGGRGHWPLQRKSRGIRPEGGMPDAEGSENDVSTQEIYAPDTHDHAEKNFTN